VQVLLEELDLGDVVLDQLGEDALSLAAHLVEQLGVGLGDGARIGSAPDRSALWAGLFDLRENLLGRAVEDLRALAA